MIFKQGLLLVLTDVMSLVDGSQVPGIVIEQAEEPAEDVDFVPFKFVIYNKGFNLRAWTCYFTEDKFIENYDFQHKPDFISEMLWSLILKSHSWLEGEGAWTKEFDFVREKDGKWTAITRWMDPEGHLRLIRIT